MDLERETNAPSPPAGNSDNWRKKPPNLRIPKDKAPNTTINGQNHYKNSRKSKKTHCGHLATDLVLSERVKVTIRLRPSTATEDNLESEAGIEIDTKQGIIKIHREESTEFKFDDVLPPSATQAHVYSVAASPIIKDILNGYNGTIMAYGQTGAGKTYTLTSTRKDELGIIPRATAEVFDMARADKESSYRVSMSYLQIYMETLQDLLKPSSSNIQIREREDSVYLTGIEEVEVKSQDDCLKLLHTGEKNRNVAFTRMNEHSSRSHAIVIVTVEKKQNQVETSRGSLPGEESQSAKCANKVLTGKLFLVDLAGSERLKKSGSEGLRAVEAKSVNLSLTSLGKCISALADPLCSHVPFRDSKLTRLLQESLGGNAKTSLVINISPSSVHITESVSSLLFGMRAMKVRARPQVNEEVDFCQVAKGACQSDTHDDKVNSLDVEVYSQDEQLWQAKEKLIVLEQQLAETKANMEEEEAAHLLQLCEKDNSWKCRLDEAEKTVSQELERSQRVYQMNLDRALTSFKSENKALTVALRESQNRSQQLENQLRMMELGLFGNRELYANKAMASGKPFVEETFQQAKQEWAASVFQRHYRARRLRMENGIQAAQSTWINAFALSVGHKLVEDSVSKASHVFQCINYRFMKLEEK